MHSVGGEVNIKGALMKDERYVLPALASVTGLAWMAAVLLISANHKGIDPSGDRAYDWANRAHTLALVLLLATVIAIHSTIRSRRLTGHRATTALVVGATLMLVGNIVAFWGALFTDGTARSSGADWRDGLSSSRDRCSCSATIGLAMAARSWPGISTARRWQIGSVGLFLTITTITWAGPVVVTLAPALLAAFALLATGTAVAQAQPEPDSPTSPRPADAHTSTS